MQQRVNTYILRLMSKVNQDTFNIVMLVSENLLQASLGKIILDSYLQTRRIGGATECLLFLQNLRQIVYLNCHSESNLHSMRPAANPPTEAINQPLTTQFRGKISLKTASEALNGFKVSAFSIGEMHSYPRCR